ncbi:hypothetical protein NDU88_004134 [Pleurodeles waltl]|uniref:Uncharacterized protein n=1 Tax=Pleurodeles waltl TaxID=8319 RepID=A0AAV7UIA7_PLEWA|nr:hypothetical protein NDU88_004134 [Pleurodeles waltl]
MLCRHAPDIRLPLPNLSHPGPYHEELSWYRQSRAPLIHVTRLLTSRPIRIEGSRDVRGRQETQKESGAGRRYSAVLSPAPRGPCC